MFGISLQFADETKRVEKASEKAAFRNFGHAAARIRKDAIASIEKVEGPSEPGTPVHTHSGATAKRAIAFDATKEDAVIGPRESIVGEAMAAHEFGEEFRGQDYPERATMGPALDENLTRFAQDWEGSIGE